MKSILIAASVVGVAAAGIILYLRNRNAAAVNAGKVVDAAANAYKTMNNHMNRAEHRAHRAMG